MSKSPFLQSVRTEIRTKQYSYRTEKSYLYWVRQFILFNDKKHPKVMGNHEIERFLNHLAVNRGVSPGTQNQALCAIIFVYKHVLKREIAILQEVQHPNIIRLIEVHEDTKYLHLITELCTGGELFDRIIAKTQSEEGHFSESDAAGIIRCILDAIAYCHDVKQIVHRDLKPENFLFKTTDEDAQIKIIDFGLSRHDNLNFGVMKTKVGTPYYVAPEVLNRQYTKSCDIWSIGVITYIL